MIVSEKKKKKKKAQKTEISTNTLTVREKNNLIQLFKSFFALNKSKKRQEKKELIKIIERYEKHS